MKRKLYAAHTHNLEDKGWVLRETGDPNRLFEPVCEHLNLTAEQAVVVADLLNIEQEASYKAGWTTAFKVVANYCNNKEEELCLKRTRILQEPQKK